MKLRDFIYIDEYKLQSFYSQIMEGLPQSFSRSREHGETNISAATESSGILNTGKDINSSEQRINIGTDFIENKIYHDHMYNDFEKKIAPEILNLNSFERFIYKEQERRIKESLFIKLSSNARIEDYDLLGKFIGDFNKLAQDFDVLSKGPSFNNHKNKSNLPAKFSDTYIKSIKNVIQEFYKNSYELRFDFHKELKVRAILNKKYLRQDIEQLNSLYKSGFSNTLTILAQVTYIPDINFNSSVFNPESFTSMKDIVYQLAQIINQMSLASSTTEDFEITVNPIAIYKEREINIV